MASVVVLAAAWVFTATAIDIPQSQLIVARGEGVSRQLIGDWEPPDAIAIAMTQPSDAHAAVLMATSHRMDTYLLVPPSEENLTSAWLTGVSPLDAVGVVELELDSDWIRDFGPIQVKVEDKGPLWLDGMYYAERPADDDVPNSLSEHIRAPVELLDLPIEGGAIISNGSGLCVSTLESFQLFGLPPTDSDSRTILDALVDQLGCQAWALVPALRNDPTSHIDMMAQFLAPDVLALASISADADAEDAMRLEEAARGIVFAAEALEIDLEVVRIPTPIDVENELYFTYVNGTHLGDAYLVPSYDSVSASQEDAAYRMFENAMPDVELLPVPADEFIALNGAVHCLTLGLHYDR